MTNKRPKALITGITGQDGSYLAELLLSKGYEVHAVVRRASTFNRSRIEHIYKGPQDTSSLVLYYGDLADSGQIANMVHAIKPDEIYHLGAQSHVKVSFDLPEYTGDITGLGTTRILEALKQSGIKSKMYQASSSEMYGSSPPPQDETTPFRPQSPYACAKVYAYWMVRNYRYGYGLWCCNGILFNHESPRRGPTFVTRKIAAGVASVVGGKQRQIVLGNLEGKRDWGYAPEYVEAMWKMLQLGESDDYVLGTGSTHSVGEFVDEAFSYVGLRPDRFVKTDRRYLRPLDVGELRANSGKALRALGWKPRVSFENLVHILVDAELKAQRLEPIGEGFEFLDKTFPNKWWDDTEYVSFHAHEASF